MCLHFIVLVLFNRYKTRTDTNLAPVNVHFSESWHWKLLENQPRCKYMKHMYMGQKRQASVQQRIAEIYSWYKSVNCHIQIGVQTATHESNVEDRHFRVLFSMNIGLKKLWTLLSSSWSQKRAEVSISKKNTTDSAQGTYLELYTWYPYGNSERCNPAEGTVHVKVFRVRNLCDITRNEIFKGYYVKHWQECPINMYVKLKTPFVYPRKRIWYNEIF